MFISQLDAKATEKPAYLGGKNCRCTSTLVWDKATQQNIGSCKTQFNGKYWCYVNRVSCQDAVESSKRPGLFYSYLACPNNQQPEPVFQDYNDYEYGIY